MTSQQIEKALQVARTMMGEYTSRMDALKPESDPMNEMMLRLADDCQQEIDRLELTLAVRKEAGAMRAGPRYCPECARHGFQSESMKDGDLCGDCGDLAEVEATETAAFQALRDWD